MAGGPGSADNTLTVVLSILADGDLEGKVLHIPGLWKQTDGKAYTEIFSGDFDFVLSGGLAEDSLLAVDVAGVTAHGALRHLDHGSSEGLSSGAPVELSLR